MHFCKHTTLLILLYNVYRNLFHMSYILSFLPSSNNPSYVMTSLHKTLSVLPVSEFTPFWWSHETWIFVLLFRTLGLPNMCQTLWKRSTQMRTRNTNNSNSSSTGSNNTIREIHATHICWPGSWLWQVEHIN